MIQAPQPRVVMIGDSSVGKTALVYRMCQGEWMEPAPTVTTSFFSYHASDGQEIQFWDTAGTERYRAVNSVYYHNATGAILVFDLTNRHSFDSLSSWVDEFMSLAQPGAILAVAGNKCDLQNQFQNFDYFTTSAQSGHHVSELAEYMAQNLPNRVFLKPSPKTVKLTDNQNGTENGDKSNSGFCC